jgi:anti-sigma factor RsiW
MKPKLLDLLYRSFDGVLSETERADLENALARSPELREEKKRLEAMRRLVASGTARSFKPFFAARVLQRINAMAGQQEDFFESLIWMFRRVALAGALTVMLLFASALLTGRAASISTLFGMPQVTIEDTLQLDAQLED